MGEMKFQDSVAAHSAILYLIEWFPEDWSGSFDPCKTYVAALSVDEATSRLTSNPRDIKRITVVGDLIERPHG